MEPIKKAMLVSIFLNEGETLPKGKKISGTAVVDDDEQNFSFTENAKRAKGYTHNPVLYSGEFSTARLLKSSNYRITTDIDSHYNLKDAECRQAIANEILSALLKMAE